MTLFLEILDGESKGTKFPLRDGLVIGRREADVIIKDSKVSGKHAKVELRPNGKTYLVDLGSSNGIKLAGKRAREIELLEGMEFVLGRTPVRVLRSRDASAGEGPPPTQEVVADEIVIESEVETWTELAQELVKRALKEGRDLKREIAPFSPILRLKFVRGVQAGTQWTIGYGPREVGSASIDLILEETGLPGVCFRLLPHHEGALIRIDPSAEVRVNGNRVDAEFLRDGDVIEIKNTQIEVEFETN